MHATMVIDLGLSAFRTHTPKATPTLILRNESPTGRRLAIHPPVLPVSTHTSCECTFRFQLRRPCRIRMDQGNSDMLLADHSV